MPIGNGSPSGQNIFPPKCQLHFYWEALLKNHVSLSMKITKVYLLLLWGCFLITRKNIKIHRHYILWIIYNLPESININIIHIIIILYNMMSFCFLSPKRHLMFLDFSFLYDCLNWFNVWSSWIQLK